MTVWLSPSHVYIGLTWAAEGSLIPIFAIFSEFGPAGLPEIQKKKNFKLNITTIKIIIINFSI